MKSAVTQSGYRSLRQEGNSMRIRAKYASRCPICLQSISVGESVEWAKGSKAKHAACVDSQKSENRSESDSVSDGNSQSGSSVKLPETSERKTEKGQEHYFTIDWMDLKDVFRRFFKTGHTGMSDYHDRYFASHSKGSSWSGFTRGQLERWMEKGYESGAQAGLQDLTPPIREKRRRVWNDNDGEFDYDRMIYGEDKFYSELTRQETIPGVAIEAGIMFSGSVNAEVVSAYNTWICRIIYALEMSGVDCQVTLDFPSHNLFGETTRGKFSLAHNIVRVKKEGERSDFLSWSAMLSPAALRCIGFNVGAMHAESKGKRCSSSFGHGVPERTEWKVVYDQERRVIVIENAYFGGRNFPEESMTQQFRDILVSMKKGA